MKKQNKYQKKNVPITETFFFENHILVGTMGLEPIQYHYWQILSLLRLPIPPRPRTMFLRILSQHLEKCQ